MSNAYAIHKKGTRDANEADLLKVAEQYGYRDFDKVVSDNIPEWDTPRFYQTCHPKDGHDVNFWDEYGFFAVEIKNLDGHDAKGTLRPREIVFRDLCVRGGHAWYKISTEQEMADLLGERLRG